MFKFVKKLICSHEWVYGRVAPDEARKYLRWPCFHDRACSRCGKIDACATRAEQELARIHVLREGISRYPSAIEVRLKLEDQIERENKADEPKDKRGLLPSLWGHLRANWEDKKRQALPADLDLSDIPPELLESDEDY